MGICSCTFEGLTVYDSVTAFGKGEITLDMKINIDKFSVNRCISNATIASGTNSITQRSLQKQNYGTSIKGCGALQIEQDVTQIVDPDSIDHMVWNGENWAMKPS